MVDGEAPGVSVGLEGLFPLEESKRGVFASLDLVLLALQCSSLVVIGPLVPWIELAPLKSRLEAPGKNIQLR